MQILIFLNTVNPSRTLAILESYQWMYVSPTCMCVSGCRCELLHSYHEDAGRRDFDMLRSGYVTQVLPLSDHNFTETAGQWWRT